MRDVRLKISVKFLFVTFVIGLNLLLANQPSAWAGPEVFDPADRLSDESLRDALQKTLRSHHRKVLDYREARIALFSRLHLKSDRNGLYVKDVYCQKEYYSTSTPGLKPGSVPDEKHLNCEHTWPQSKFSGSEKGTMKSDLHHLFPSDSEMNSKRGNLRFGEVNGGGQELKCPQSELGRGPRGDWIFEPPMVHKGNVARALFYFAVRYDVEIDTDQEKALREWNRQDPVDRDEQDRNEQIERLQGNRNPFIDHPEWVDRISNF